MPFGLHTFGHAFLFSDALIFNQSPFVSIQVLKTLEASTKARELWWSSQGSQDNGQVVRARVPLSWDERVSDHKQLQMERRYQDFRADRATNMMLADGTKWFF